MNPFLDEIGVECSFRQLQENLGRINLFCKGDAPSVKETQEEKAFADIAAKKWKYYQDTFKPLEKKYMDDVESLNTEEARSFASGSAASSTSAAFDVAQKQAASELTSAGLNPTSGRYQATMGGLSDYQGMATTENMTMAENSVDDQYVGGLKNISAMGKGQATTAQAGFGDLATSASNKATNDAMSAFNKRAGTINAVGTVAGLASYGLGN